MSLFKVVPELRSRGVPAAVAAWYPWRTKDTQQPMADICGIFMCVPGCTAQCMYSQTIFEDPFWWELDEHEENGGPGQSLHTYLPKGQDIVEKVTETFTECPPAVAGKGQSKKGKTKDDETAETFTERPPAVAGKGQSKKGKTKDNETAKGKCKGKGK